MSSSLFASRVFSRTCAVVLVLATMTTVAVDAQGPPPASPADAPGILRAVSEYMLFNTDSLPSVRLPSPKALLRARPGQVAVVVLATGRRSREIGPLIGDLPETLARGLADRGLTHALPIAIS